MLATYAYDTLGRLTQTQDGTTGTPIETYAYDATGNRTALTTATGVANYTYPASSHRLTAVDGDARGHDAAGNTTSIGSKAFTYNDGNRMNAVKQGNAVLESYAYNHRGERVLRTPAGGTAQITLYDEAGQWLGNYSASGDAQQQAIWLDNYPVALINVPAAGVPELAYIQPDHLGTPRVVIDPVRDVAIWEWSNKSEVFGDQIPSADPDGDGAAFELALRFPGQQATDASGMFYNYQREYDPTVGRYSQSDPIGLAGGIARYVYVDSAPIVATDAAGLRKSLAILSASEQGGMPLLGDNPFGHIALATGSGLYSYGTAHNYGSSARDYIQSQVANRNVEIVEFETSLSQELMMERVMRSHSSREYDVKSNNCATAVADSLISINAIKNRSILPGRVFQDAYLIEGAKYHFIPKGGVIPSSLSGVINGE